jgi:pyruvate dehydrogenase E2 component (dihydrolipoamide acetyltransferase)
VRKLSRELGVDLAAVRGTGPRGRIQEEDVRAAASGPKPMAAVETRPASTAKPTPPAGGLEERMPVVGIRRRIAEKMQKSKNTAAHFTYVEEVDMTHLVHLRDKLKPKAEKKGAKLTYLPFIIRAVVAALKDHPTLNGSLDDERGEVVVKRYYNVGIATATEAGLIVPVVHDADKKDLYALAREI